MTKIDGITYSRINYWFTIFISNMTMIALGNAFAWTSPTLPILQAPDSVFPINDNEASWITAIYSLGAIFGPYFASPVKEFAGFKWAFFVISVLMLVSWTALATTTSIYVFYVARFLSGISAGMNYNVLPMYIAEISEDSLRSAVNSLPQTFRCLAYFQMYCVGPFVSYHVLIIVASLASVVYICFIFWMPESPYYLKAKGKEEKCLETVRWLRGGVPENNARIVIVQIQAFLDRSKREKKSWSDLATRSNMKGLFIAFSLFTIQQMTGVTVIIGYTKQIFDMTGTTISSSLSSIIFGGVYLVGSIFGPMLTKKYGFKEPLILSAIGIFISEAVLGTYLYFSENGYNVSSYFYLPIACVVMYAISYSVGLGPLPPAIMGDIFPANMRGFAAALSLSVSFIFAFIIAKLFPILSETLGACYVFWMFAASSIPAILITVFLVPNTKGLSLDQIQDLLENVKKSKNKLEEISVIS